MNSGVTHWGKNYVVRISVMLEVLVGKPAKERREMLSLLKGFRRQRKCDQAAALRLVLLSEIRGGDTVMLLDNREVTGDEFADMCLKAIADGKMPSGFAVSGDGGK